MVRARDHSDSLEIIGSKGMYERLVGLLVAVCNHSKRSWAGCCHEGFVFLRPDCPPPPPSLSFGRVA